MISVIGLPKTNNLGDPVLLENTIMLIKRVLPEEDINVVDMDQHDMAFLGAEILNFFRKVFRRLLRFGTPSYWKAIIRLQHFLSYQYYSQRVQKSNAIIFAGGGIIKYRYEELGIKAALIVEIAAKNNIPVMFNAVGVEGFDANNPQAKYLREMMNERVVKVITTRDDLQTLTGDYLTNPSVKSAWNPDPAWWTDVTFDTSSSILNTRSDCIGLGMVRKGIFQANGFDFDDDELFSFWKKICDELVSKNIPFEFFTNGVEGDQLFVDEFVNKYSQFASIPIRIPDTPQQLIDIIGSYTRILCSRMHTSIIAYSLNVPSISIVWNAKIKMFYSQIKHPSRTLEVNQMRTQRADTIVERLMDVEYDNDDLAYRLENRDLTANSIEEFLLTYV